MFVASALVAALLAPLAPAHGAQLAGADAEAAAVSRECTLGGIRLAGKVKVVDAFADLKVKVVDSFPDLKVRWVDAFPDECGRWQKVDAFPDFTIQLVDAFPDLTIREVDAFPGLP
ncbi:MAG: hypothetical protein H6710_01510 [Myxococcales bacterium]|nr:hypothetical protein [Myxococcales bacterium]MCB9702916.1 hypothetical protein [Myxococcales bacterium]